MGTNSDRRRAIRAAAFTMVTLAAVMPAGICPVPAAATGLSSGVQQAVLSPPSSPGRTIAGLAPAALAAGGSGAGTSGAGTSGAGTSGAGTSGPAPAGPPPAGLVSSADGITQGDIAVQFALAQLGKPYVYGATGPYGYDCSGLALASWRAAGVELPRTAAEQYLAGSHVPLDQLQPGDLVFWASDISDPDTIYHVAISLGGDQTVQASQTGEPVHVIALWPEGLVRWATRP
jgi:peptidoglycan DL-endopeptidase CwlO